MLLLDTNVVSEFRKIKSGKADQKFTSWAEGLDSSQLFVSSIAIMELEIGILSIERRDKTQGSLLREWFENQVIPEFSERTLAIDTRVALRCARLHVPNKRSDRDALIAATALVHGMTVVTRNVSDFKGTKVNLLNPWE